MAGDRERRIRLALAGDAASVTEIVMEAYRHYVPRIGREPGPMGDDYAALIAGGQVWVLEEGGVLAGLVVILSEPARFLLDNIAVAPAFQGRGFGRVLMEFVERRARAEGHAAVTLYTHVMMTENIAMYKKLGFVETGRVSEKGFDRVYMAKALA